MTPRITTTPAKAFAFNAILLTALTLVAFGQGSKEKGGPESSEPSAKAEELFKESLTLPATTNRELVRRRLLEATRLWMKIGEPEKAARACLQMGDCYNQGKSYQESLYYYKKALEMKPLSARVKAVAFNSIAQIYAELYQSTLALSYYDQALKQARMSKDISAQTLALTGLADLYHQQGEAGRAITCIARARHLNQQQKNYEAEASLSHLAGRIDQEKGMIEQARKAFDEAQAIYQRIGNEEGQIKVLCSSSSLYLSSAQKQMALEQAEQAVNMAEERAGHAVSNSDKTRARDLRWRAWLSQARAQRAVGQKKGAAKSFERAIQHMEGVYLLVHVSTEASAVAFREECQAPYRELVDLLIERGQFKEACDWAELARARVMVSLIEGRRKMRLPKKAEQADPLREQSRYIVGLRAQLLSSQISPEQQAKLQSDLIDAENKLTEAQLRAEMEQARKRLIGTLPADIKQLQERMTRDKHIMLEFLLEEDRSFAWLISSNNVSLEILPGKKEIEKAIKQYTELISVAPNNLSMERDVSRVREQAGGLFSILFGRLSAQLVAGQKLIIVPDGLLNYLPFEALIHNGRYLIEDHEISYLPSASMLGRWQDSESRADAGAKMELLAFGDPTFGPGLKASGRKQPKISHIDVTRQMRASRGFNLPPLPRTRDEVEFIAGLFPPDRRQVYLGKESTEKAVKQGSLRLYRRLHFATHSLIDEKSPSRSAVVLALDNDPEEDGFLEVGEISELDLDCDLVVLSACQTGRGQLLSGEGILGLSRAFLYAGARSVVVSLWNVTDISTGQLMKTFYEHLMCNSSNAAALREAKLRMLRSNKETRHPYYWAPFIIVGKP